MSDISNLVDDIISQVDIIDIISKYVKLKKVGSNYSAICPFHKEKTPSFMVSPSKQIFKCFGCGVGGNAIKFVMEIEKIDFWDAIKLIGERYNIDIKKYLNNKNLSYNTSDNQKEILKQINLAAQKFFQKKLQENTQALEYLHTKRQLNDEVINYFGIGFAPDSFYELVDYLKKNFDEKYILKSGLAKQNSNGELYSFFKNRITFPIFDNFGNIVGFSARILNPQDNPKYLNTPENILFHKSQILYGLSVAKKFIKDFNKIIVVEGQMDVIAGYRLNYPVCVASSGTALTQQHLKLLSRYSENLYFLFDQDEAGFNATIRAIKLAYSQNIFPKIIQLPQEIKDLDEYANLISKQQEENNFPQIIENSKDSFERIITNFSKKYDLNFAVDYQKFLHKIFEILAIIPDISIQFYYLQKLSEKINKGYEILTSQFKYFLKNQGKFFNIQNNQETKNEIINQEEIFLSLNDQEFLNNFIPSKAEKLKEIFIFLQENQLLNEISKQKLAEGQLRLENNFSLVDENKKIAYLKNILNKNLKQISFQITKKNWSNDKKIELLNQIKQFIKNF